MKFTIALLINLIFIFPIIYADDYKQPVKFSHGTHASLVKIPCEFCHSMARRTIISGVPPDSLCYGCHQVILGSTENKKQEIKNFLNYWETKKTIQWKKIHDLPDFVVFSHKRHIKAGFDCTECHGDISILDELTMKNMKTNLGMGWCVTCHKTKHPAINGKVVKPQRNTRGGKIIRKTIIKANSQLQASKDCLICHK
jgi:hypothetical protein